jgi:hypothetical protein
MTTKRASEMSETERTAKLAELRKGPKPEPMDVSRTAQQMTAAERAAFVRECSRRFG